ncbi:MAG: chromate resistance protein [Burkholderiales bacterium]|nr:chromate resistance protein [Burkholderiales bacterium]
MDNSKKLSDTSAWLLLVVSLPTQSATARMRIWRAFKTLGCAALRDGAYLLPATDMHSAALQELADECVREGGSAWLMQVTPASSADAPAYALLFERSADFASLIASWKTLAATLPSLTVSELTRLQKKLLREYQALLAIDFFPGESSLEAEVAWSDFKQRVERILSPDEPQGSEAQIARLDIADYQARLWATRRSLWVDRVASAWLIQRFIDPAARFLWLSKPADCPRKALGFDFDGAAFSHVGERVSFETLMASFGLEDDPALLRMGAMVRSLDIGDGQVAEGAGFEAMLAGARERLPDDDALLAEVGGVLDSLYAHFGARAKT